MPSLMDFALSMSRSAPTLEQLLVPEPVPRSAGARRARSDLWSRHKAGDHGLCDPASPRHGVCSQCGKTIQVGPTSASPERRRCRDCRIPAARVCDLCEESYTPRQGHRPDQSFCSKSCKTAWQNGARPPYERHIVVGMPRKTLLSRKRRLRRAQTWDGVRDAEILERDGWRCGICRKVIGKSFKYPHPRSKSVDHIVPLSQGGDDTAANKRAAHLGCNNGRCNRGGGEQLAMIG